MLLALALFACTRSDRDSETPRETDPPIETDPPGETDLTETDIPETDLPDTDTDEPLPGTGVPVVVYFTMDTLGAAAARDTGWCERVNGILAGYGLDAACVQGAISPSSWTPESHVRMLWPEHMADPYRWNEKPECGAVGVLPTLRDALDGKYYWGADNAMIANRLGQTCPGGIGPWHQEADEAWQPVGGAQTPQDVEEEDRPAHFALERILEEVARGGAVVGFLNAFEVGGHFPRCWHDPDTESCQEMWALALDKGFVEADDNPGPTWLNGSAGRDIIQYLQFSAVDQEFAVRPMMWGSMKDAIEYHRGPLFDDRLRTLLAGLDAAGRLGDLTLVMLGDHGESPCMKLPFHNQMNCMHTGLPNEFTGIVPVMITPASQAQEWEERGFIGDATRPWSTANLAWALLDEFGVATPPEWPEMEPPGAANSWSCRVRSGVRVIGNTALICEGPSCGAFTWDLPTDLSYTPEAIAPIPPEFVPYAGSPNWFQDCGGP